MPRTVKTTKSIRLPSPSAREYLLTQGGTLALQMSLC